ncbi:hypothetical protein PPROV_000512500 [Pycnococcus provasolii]|uniref:Translin-associated factor X-interacting protein 1 N-terminal domain-containing protein n=1 Tax=Pycnococcus provasolii TaxID=41880 RepID=A0A830HKN2_9CHLO|nr:hypothetical protein PPROV_000512500 [Pycnococcus provasolii]
MFPVDVSYGGSSNPPAAAVTNVGLQLGPRFQKFQGAQQTTGTHTHMRPASASSRLLSSASTASAVAPKTHADSQRGATKQNKPPFRPSSRTPATSAAKTTKERTNATATVSTVAAAAQAAQAQAKLGARHSTRRAVARQRAPLKPSGQAAGLSASRSAVFGTVDVFPSAAAALAATTAKGAQPAPVVASDARPPLKAQNSAPLIPFSFKPKVNASKLGFRPPPPASGPAGATRPASATDALRSSKSATSVAMYRSAALTLEVQLQERLAALDQHRSSQRTATERVAVASEIFDKAIESSGPLKALLSSIKQEYDAALGNVAPTKQQRRLSARSARVEEASRAARRKEEEMVAAAAAAELETRAVTAERRAKELERQHRETTRQVSSLREQRDRLQGEVARYSEEHKIISEEREIGQRREMELTDLLDALRHGEVTVAQLNELHGGSPSAHGAEAEVHVESAFKDVPAEEVTWDIPLSARNPKERPKGVPTINISLLGEDTHTDADKMMAELNAEAAANAEMEGGGGGGGGGGVAPGEASPDYSPLARAYERAPSRANRRRHYRDDDDDDGGDYIDEDSDDMDGFESIANASRISMGDLFSGSSPEGISPDTGPSAVNSP